MRINEENRNRNGHVLIWDQPGLNMDDKKSKSKTHTTYLNLPNYCSNMCLRIVCLILIYSFASTFLHHQFRYFW